MAIAPLLVLGAVVAAVAWRRAEARRIDRDVRARLPLGADGIVTGAGDIIHDARGTGAALLLHGCGDTPQTLRFLAYRLHTAGLTVHAPLLPGHGRTLRDFDASSADEWIGAARSAYETLRGRHPQVSLVGLSMGGAIAVILAAESPPPALVLIAPYLEMPRTVRRLAQAHRFWQGASYVRSGDPRSLHDPEARAASLAYGATTARVLRQLLTVVERAWDALPRVHAPTLVLQSRSDNRLAAGVPERALARMPAASQRLVWVEGGHVVTVDVDRERVAREVESWIATHTGSAPVRTPPS